MAGQTWKGMKVGGHTCLLNLLSGPCEVTILGIFLLTGGLFRHSRRGWYRSIPQGLHCSDQSIWLLHCFPSSCRAGNQLCVSYSLGLNPGSLEIAMHIVLVATSARKIKRRERNSPRWLPQMKCMLINSWFIFPWHGGGKTRRNKGNSKTALKHIIWYPEMREVWDRRPGEKLYMYIKSSMHTCLWQTVQEKKKNRNHAYFKN